MQDKLFVILFYSFSILIIFHYSYDDTMNRNNLAMAQNNTFNTLGRNGGSSNTYNRNSGFKDLSTSTLGRNKRYSEMPIQNPLFSR